MLRADRDLVRVLHRGTAERRWRLQWQNLAIRICRNEGHMTSCGPVSYGTGTDAAINGLQYDEHNNQYLSNLIYDRLY